MYVEDGAQPNVAAPGDVELKGARYWALASQLRTQQQQRRNCGHDSQYASGDENTPESQDTADATSGEHRGFLGHHPHLDLL